MFNMFPYLNLHKINLDYIIKTVDQAVSTVQQSVERIEAALGTVNGLTSRVEALEASTQQLSASVEGLEERLNSSYRRIGVLETNVENLEERLNSSYRRIGVLEGAVASKAQLPIIVNLSADAFPAQIPAADQAQVRAALTALNTGTGAAQAHIEQQVDQNLPAAFNIRLSYAGDGILTGILSQTIYDGNAQEYLSRITTVSINSSAMTWEMGSQTVKPGMEYMLRYNLQTLTPDDKRQARANISAAYTEDVAPKAIQLTATNTTSTAGTWTGATWVALVAHARNGGIIVVNMGDISVSFTAAVNTSLNVITSPFLSIGAYIRLTSDGAFSMVSTT